MKLPQAYRFAALSRWGPINYTLQCKISGSRAEFSLSAPLAQQRPPDSGAEALNPSLRMTAKGPLFAVTRNVAIRLGRSRYVIQGSCCVAAGARPEDVTDALRLAQKS